MDNLVIVESPTKANTINRYLGSKFEVRSSKGHVRDLPKKELGVEIEKGFQPNLVINQKKLVKKLKKASKDKSNVFLATDNDREGEAIAFDLYELLSQNGNGGKETGKFKRIIFNEITKNSIEKALDNPTDIDLKKVDAQRARRILDRLVGYLISPLLSKTVSGSRFEGLSAGRVQSVALRYIVEREEEREKFDPEEYWKVAVDLYKEKKSDEFQMNLKKIRGEKPDIGSEEQANEVKKKLTEARFEVSNLKDKQNKRSPLPPFITSTMQRAASSVLSFTPSKTMSIAQTLYEGVELDKGVEGLITYMRTDSTRVAKEANNELRKFINKELGSDYLSEKTRYYQKSSAAQDAHEAIRPTDVRRRPKKIKKHLSSDQYKLYKLIWDRFVATQMSEARYRRRKITVKANGFQFKTSGSTLVFDGFLKVLKLKPLKDQDVTLPDDLQVGDRLNLKKVDLSQNFTKPPGRYTEAGLIKKLEKQGIGRPSTYASIISTIQKRDYIVKRNSSFVPTLLGYVAVEFLEEYFPEIVEPDLTAKMEKALDEIKDGENSKEKTLAKFYAPLKKELNRVEDSLESNENSFQIPTDVECSSCDGHMNIRYWKGSPYLSCSSWPECEEKISLPSDISFTFRDGKVLIADELEKKKAEEKELGEKECPKCGSAMEIKHGKYGRFYACTNPDCDETASVSTGVECPNCDGGELLERYSRKRKQTFYGCSNYPDCKYTTNDKPIKQCPACESGVLVKSDDKLVCTNKSCNHEEDAN
ncbi:type I DNA topoisomerase [Candidatus Bipolaricaulota bacterium]|nr:type I DNA topoisomerase [Candidatus Bipolaricaulota bacterium]